MLRGESKEFDSAMLPSISRSTSFKSIPYNEENPTTYITNEETSIIETFSNCLPKDELFHTQNNGINNINIICLAQHYGRPTRLLDITYDPLVALYFACFENLEDDGYIYFLTDPHQIPIHHIDSNNYKKAFDFYLENHTNYKETYQYYNFIYRYPYVNARANAQKGGFLFNIDPSKQLIHGTLVYKIPADCKTEIMEHLKFVNISKCTLGLS